MKYKVIQGKGVEQPIAPLDDQESRTGSWLNIDDISNYHLEFGDAAALMGIKDGGGPLTTELSNQAEQDNYIDRDMADPENG